MRSLSRLFCYFVGLLCSYLVVSGFAPVHWAGLEPVFNTVSRLYFGLHSHVRCFCLSLHMQVVLLLMAVITLVAGSILGARDFGAQLNVELHRHHHQPPDKHGTAVDTDVDTASVVGGAGANSNGSGSSSGSMRRSVSCASRSSGDSPTGSPHSVQEDKPVRYSDGQEVGGCLTVETSDVYADSFALKPRDG